MPYLANIDVLVWAVIIVISIVVQIVKATRKASSEASQPETRRSAPAEQRAAAQSGRTPPPRQTYSNRSDEIRQFFENLGLPVQEVAPPPPPRNRKQHQKPKPTPVPMAARKPSLEPTKMATVELETLERDQQAPARELRSLLKARDTQRQAVLLREILGPPLALR